MKQTLRSENDSDLTVIEGIDEICQVCPWHLGEECDSPTIKELDVRRLDSLLLRRLGVSYGKKLKVRDWQSLVARNRPCHLCHVCRWREHCDAQVL